MINCTKCGAALPDWVQNCQFCQADVRNVQRPPQTKKEIQRGFQTAKWIWPAYYIVSVYFVLTGLWDVTKSVITMNSTQDNVAGQLIDQFSWFGIIIGSITAIIGIGLIAKVEFIRGIVNIFCWLQIAVNLLGLAGSLLAGAFVGPMALIGAVIAIFNIATAALMIYLIGETD